MRKNISRVIEAFNNRTPASGDSKHTCWTDGHSIYSYQMLIGFRAPDVSAAIFVVNYADAPSQTTRTQVRAVESAFPNAIRFPAK